MPENSTVIIALGSNLGDRSANIEFGRSAISRLPGTNVLSASSLYTGRAHKINPDENQPDYVNAVILIETELIPDALLEACMHIERACGRDRTEASRWQSRTLDLDIIVYGDRTISNAHLTVPHPRLAERRFVLEPLVEIAPDMHIPPPFDAPVQYLLDHCKDPIPVEILKPESVTDTSNDPV